MVLLVGQSLVNIGVATGILPTTGLPFPLFSYGGSSMIASLITAGVLIRVARESRDAEVIVLSRPKPNGTSTSNPFISPDKQSELDAKDRQRAKNLSVSQSDMDHSIQSD